MINGLPLYDLHRHLDGSVRLGTILDLAKKHNIDLPEWTEESLRPYVQITEKQPGVMAFIENFQYMTAIMVDEESCYRIAYEAVEDLQKEKIDYAELRFSPWFMADANQIDAKMVTRAVVAGAKDASKAVKIPIGLIGILSRTYGPEIAWKEFEALQSCRDDIIALDLAGDEFNFPGTWFVSHFKAARDIGWNITVHAGEASGHESIWQAIKELGAQRIGHGVNAFEDPSLIDYMREHDIGVESNLTSNVQTSTVESYNVHPLKKFLEAGVEATINTDAPGISGITLLDEYEFAKKQAGLNKKLVVKAQKNAISQAFLPEAAKKQLIDTEI